MTSLFTAPTSAPLDVSVDDVNDCSLTIKWTTPETVGASGLNGYTVEYCKDGGKCVYVQLHLSPECQRADRFIAGCRPYTAGISLSPYPLVPLLEVPNCSDDSVPSRISSCWPLLYSL